MSTLFVLLFLASLGLLTWGLIAPKSLAKQANKATKKELTRKHFAVFFGLAAFMFLILTGMTAPSQAEQGNAPKPAASQTAQEPKVETKEETETKEIAFTSSTVNDASLAQGTTKVTTAGVNGVQSLTYKVTYTDGKETAKELVSDTVTTAPVNQVTTVGTYVAPPPPPVAQSNCHPSYSGCVPNVSYDLDCPDIGRQVRVIGPDVFRLDADDDGIGCDSY